MTTALTEKQAVKTDPELLRQLNAAQRNAEPVAGIFRLRPEDSTKLVNSAERTSEIVKEVFERVAKKVGTNAQRFNVLRNLGVIIVSAEPKFISELLEQPEIYSAMANQSAESGKIEPFNKRRVSESAIDKPVKTARGSKAPGSRSKSRSSSHKKPIKKAAKKR